LHSPDRPETWMDSGGGKRDVWREVRSGSEQCRAKSERVEGLLLAGVRAEDAWVGVFVGGEGDAARSFKNYGQMVE
jgi:hypothetical protein